MDWNEPGVEQLDRQVRSAPSDLFAMALQAAWGVLFLARKKEASQVALRGSFSALQRSALSGEPCAGNSSSHNRRVRPLVPSF
jgi:hypothetical protein